jgi:hypothetical protein
MLDVYVATLGFLFAIGNSLWPSALILVGNAALNFVVMSKRVHA